MKINTRLTSELMQRAGLTVADVSMKTGLSEKSLEWILANGYISEDALERIADVLDTAAGELMTEEPGGSDENIIEFQRNMERATLTLTQGRFKSRIRKLAAEHPEECEIVAENQDGSLCAHVPVKWIRIQPPKKISESQMEAARKNFEKNRSVGREKG